MEYREYTCKLTKDNCVDLLQALAITKGKIDYNYSPENYKPEDDRSKNLEDWEMIFILEFPNLESLKQFCNLGFYVYYPDGYEMMEGV